MLIKPAIELIPAHRPLINIGALMDITTGEYVYGIHNEAILNGGLANVTGFIGEGNNFKSTIMSYMTASAAEKVLSSIGDTSITVYDTECQTAENRVLNLFKHFKTLNNEDLVERQILSITDSTKYMADEFITTMKNYLAEKKKAGNKIAVDTQFLERDHKSLMKMLPPTFTIYDSLSASEFTSITEVADKVSIDDSARNPLQMRAGLIKSNFISELPRLSTGSNHYFLLSAQVGKEIQMPTGPMPQQQHKALQWLKNGIVIKGATKKFTYHTGNCWYAYSAQPLINQSTKEAEYPMDDKDTDKAKFDLSIVNIRQLRSKTGLTGIVLPLIVSQSEGLLPELTDFHFIRENMGLGFGFEGNTSTYRLCILPEVTLSRNRIRTEIKNNPILGRALNITSELIQMRQFWTNLDPEIHVTPKQLYEDLKVKGYDWNILLNTRGWHALNNDNHPTPYLSTLDLLRMRLPENHPNFYKPYWL